MQKNKTYYTQRMLEYGYDKYLDEVDWNYVKPDVTSNDLYEMFYFDRFKNNYKFGRPSYEQYQKYLYESLMYSYDIALLKNKLYDKCESIRRIYHTEDSMKIYAYDNSEKDKIESISKFYGYFIAGEYIERNNHVYIIETIYGVTELTDYVYNECKGALYHITNIRNANKILTQGLCTKSRNKRATHPERIYFTIANNEDVLNDLALNLYPDGNYTILKINLNENIEHKCKFFINAAYEEYGVWTCDMIAPKCIKILTEIKGI